jgi:hypothetical protein
MSTKRNSFSDLQLVPHSDYAGLQTAKDVPIANPETDTFKINADSEEAQDIRYKIAGTTDANWDPSDDKYTPEPQRICGLKRRTFLIVAGIATIVIIAAAVGGGVGGALSNKHSDNAASLQSAQTALGSLSSSSTNGPAASRTKSVAITTTEVRGPSATLLRDCPSSNETIFDVSFGSSNMAFRKFCSQTLVNSNNGLNAVVTPTKSLDDCINLCAAYNIQNKTEISQGTSSICNVVCWRNTFDSIDDFPGMCFGYTTQNSSNSFAMATESHSIICDSAALINQ